MPPVDYFSGGKGGMSEKLCNFADDLNEKDMKKSILAIILALGTRFPGLAGGFFMLF